MPDSPSVPLPHATGPLTGYRVLDFSDEKGQLCARLLAELGADVIKVEPRGGDPSRLNGPFYKSEVETEHSLWWWTMNAGKRSVTCELRLEQGRELARGLAAKSDIVIETWVPGRAKELGLDYATLSALNPALILVSITNFGQSGPYKDMAATDIVGSAMGGQMYLNGDPVHGPVRTLAPQAYTQANLQGGVGAMTALYARGAGDGLGQHVDVSMQEAVANTMDHAQQTWDIKQMNMSGPGLRRFASGVLGGRYLFEARDGWVASLGGLMGPSANELIDWLAETGEDRGLASASWREKLGAMIRLPDDEREFMEQTLDLFCKKRLKEELVAEAQRRGAGWAPVFSPREIVESKQLAGRDYWVMVRHEDLGESFVYPGAPFKLSETPWAQRGRAPHAGEHNEQVYGDLLGLEPAELRRLKMRMVI